MWILVPFCLCSRLLLVNGIWNNKRCIWLTFLFSYFGVQRCGVKKTIYLYLLVKKIHSNLSNCQINSNCRVFCLFVAEKYSSGLNITWRCTICDGFQMLHEVWGKHIVKMETKFRSNSGHTNRNYENVLLKYILERWMNEYICTRTTHTFFAKHTHTAISTFWPLLSFY